MKKVMIVLCLASFVMVGSVFGAVTTYFDNDEGTGDGLWRTCSNWTNGCPDKSDPYSPAIFNEAVTCTVDDPNGINQVYPVWQFHMGDGASAGGQVLNITGGTLDVEYHFLMGWSDYDGVTTVNMSGGFLNIAAGGHIWFGNGAGNQGVLTITGGTINCGGGLLMPWDDKVTNTAFLDLQGGIVNAASLYLNPRGLIQVGNGVLVLDGDQIAVLAAEIDAGQIVLSPSLPVDAVLDTSFDGTNTTLRAFVPGPKQAKDPSPAKAANYVDKEPTLTWTAGDEAVSHDVYFGKYGDELSLVSDDQAGTSYGPLNLEWGNAYSWRIDEYDGVGIITGEEWYFTVTDHLLVENFEYSDPNVFIVNWSPTAKGDLDLVNGYPVYLKPGTQSLKLAYDNSQSPYYKEATRNWATDQDWTYEGVEVLSLWFEFAVEADFDGLYIEISDGTNTAVLTNADSYADIDTAYEGWQEINLDLSQFTNVDMTKVRTLTIGMGSPTPTPGNANLVNIDEIRLYPKRCFEGAPIGDVTGDCKVNLLDIVEIAGSWLTDGLWPN